MNFVFAPLLPIWKKPLKKSAQLIHLTVFISNNQQMSTVAPAANLTSLSHIKQKLSTEMPALHDLLQYTAWQGIPHYHRHDILTKAYHICPPFGHINQIHYA
jgi:hypothetical protein